MDNANSRCYTKGTKFHLMEVGNMTKAVAEVQELQNKPSLSKKFDELTRDKEASEVIELFERDFAFQFGAPGTYLADLFKEGK